MKWIIDDRTSGNVGLDETRWDWLKGLDLTPELAVVSSVGVLWDVQSSFRGQRPIHVSV